MATLKDTQSRRMYSWWWDSHISPKNSKWLQDNLTDMDSKLKAMIKLIEEDADSFARRAEMYYKKRPELMKLVEEFYRAYRALAERYDHATVVIRQAHRTMTEAFPNQVPPLLGEDSPVNPGPEDDPRTPEVSTHTHALFQTDDVQKDALELSSSHLNDTKSNGENTEGSDFVARRKGFKQSHNLSGSGDYHKLADRRVRKGLNFQDMDEKEQSVESREDHGFQAQDLPESGQVHEPEEILLLRKALADVEAEKEAGLLQYQHSLDKLSKLESEIARAREDSRELSEQASVAEAEVQNLKDAITKLEAEKDANLLQYHQCLDKISNLEDIISQAEKNARELDERASKAETEALSLKDELAKLTSEKDAALDQYVLSLEKISHLENRLQLVEEDARKSSERAKKAEREIETLRQEISKLTEEKEAAALQYQQCLGTISSLENKLLSTQEEAQRLRVEIDNGVAKLKGAEEQCVMLERSNQSLHAELESLMLKMGAQGQELTEKQKEVGRLWSCVQEERLHFVEAETAFQTLQHLHAQTQEELRTLALELQNRVQMLKDIEAHNQGLQDEVSKIKEENMGLNELNVSSAMSIKNMQEQITILTEAKGKLEEEVELRVDQRNALQQEIYCLKEELNDLNKKHLSVLEQVHAVGFNPERLKSSVTELQDENSNLKEACEREKSEKKALLEKLEILGQLLEKNSILENSLSDLSAELEAVRGKINALEESCQSLLQEKSVLLDEKASLESQLQAANANLETLSEKNTVLENSLFDAHDELQTLKVKSKSLEDSCQLLVDQNAGLATEKDNLSSQLEITQLRSEELEKRLADLRERYLLLEKDKASALCKIEELQISLDGEKQEHASFTQMNETRFAAIQSKMNLLQEKCQLREREFDIELDRAVHSEIEIFILQRCGEDLKESNESLSIKYEKLLEASTLSENLISQLQKENIEQQNEVKSLSQQTSILRKGILPLLMALDLVLDGACPETFEQDLLNLTSVSHKIEEVKRSFNKTEEENELLCLEKMVLVTLLQQLRLEAEGLKVEKSNIEQELKTRNKHFSMLQTEAAKLHTMNEGFKVKLMEGNHREEALMTEVRSLQRKLLDVQGSLEVLHTENLKILEEKQSLVEETVLLKDNNYTLEEENYVLCGETLSTVYLSLIFKNYIDENTLKMRELGEHLDKLQFVNAGIQEKLNSTERTLEEVQVENHSLQESLQKSEDELKFVTEIKDKLIHEIEMAKNLLHEEREKAKIHEGTLQSELQKQMNEIEMLETHAAALFGQLQTSTVYQVLYEQKIHELTEAFDSLRDASTVKDTDIELLKERVSMLKIENHSLQESLQKSQDELKFVTEIKDKLIHEIEMAKNLLHEEHEKAKIHEEVYQVLYEQKIQELTEAFDSLRDASTVKDTDIELLKERVSMLKIENHSLQESLQKSEDELKFVTEIKDKLIHEIEMAKNLLHEEREKAKIHEETLQSELQKQMNEIEMLETHAAALFGQLQTSTVYQVLYEQKIHELTEAFDSLRDASTVKDTDIELLKERVSMLKIENHSLQESLQKSEDELKFVTEIKDKLIHEIEMAKNLLHEEREKAKIHEETLQSELQKQMNEIEMLETHAAALFGQLQTSTVYQVLYEQKIHELTEAFDSLRDASTVKDTDIEVLKERVSMLTAENEGLNVQLAAYGPAVTSLKNCISSLEDKTSLRGKIQKAENEELEGAEVANDLDEHCFVDEEPDFQNLQNRVRAIEKKVVEREQIVMQENSDVRSQLEAALTQIDELKSEGSLRRRKFKPTSETSEAENNTLLTKDIILDQVNEHSPFGISRKQPVEPDNGTLELSETADQDHSIDLTVDKAKEMITPTPEEKTNFLRIKSVKKQKGENPASDALVEKELAVDKLEVSKNSVDHIQEGNNRKVLQRLNSDVHKLMNLHITVQDLKRKLEITEKSRKGKAVDECDTLKGQLEEAEATILKLFDLNGKLMKNMEVGSFSSEKKSTTESEDFGSARREISGQARRISEKIGRVQMEVQKIQFVLLKLDDEKESKGKTKGSETRRVRLRDYLYGGLRTNHTGRKKTPFCACIQPSTYED